MNNIIFVRSLLCSKAQQWFHSYLVHGLMNSPSEWMSWISTVDGRVVDGWMHGWIDIDR